MTTFQTCPAVPGDQWGPEDLKQLQADLLPIDEPHWTDKTLFGPRGLGAPRRSPGASGLQPIMRPSHCAGTPETRGETPLGHMTETVMPRLMPHPQTVGFQGVPDDVWNFHIGGYQVCEKWLKDRGPKKGNPGRILSPEDIDHYHRIAVALSETVRIMREIDESIESHGGWPDAFATPS